MSFKPKKIKEMKEDCNLIDVVEYFGYEISQRGSVKSILCPNPAHNDQHKGNCYVNKDKINCFCCGYNADVYDFLQVQLNCTFNEAGDWLYNFLGNNTYYLKDEVNNKEYITQKDKMITPELLNFLRINNTPVSVIKNVSQGKYHIAKVYKYKGVNELGYDNFELTEQRETWTFYDYDKKDDSVAWFKKEEKVISNPFMELLKEDKIAAYNIIINKANELLDDIEYSIDYYIKNLSDHPEDYKDFINLCKKAEKRCNNIIKCFAS